MKKVYVAGPYTKGDVAVNVRKAMLVAHELMHDGYAPYCPHLSHFLHLQESRPYEDWINLDKEWLKVCDAVLRFEGESKGADMEVKLAEELGMPVFYDIETLLGNL